MTQKFKNPKTGEEIELKTPAIHIGAIFDHNLKKVSQVWNPAFEEEFALDESNLQSHESLKLYPKKDLGIEGEMSLDDVYNFIQKLEKE